MDANSQLKQVLRNAGLSLRSLARESGVLTIPEPRLLLLERVGALADLFHHLLAKDLGGHLRARRFVFSTVPFC